MRHCLVSLLLTLATAGLCLAQTEAGEMDTLASRADAIVVGELQSGAQSGYSVAFNLSVVRVLKGELVPGDTIAVTWNSGRPAERQFKGNYGMWFLSHAESGPWQLLGIYKGHYPLDAAYLPLSKSANPASVKTMSSVESASETASDRIAVEVVASMRATKDRSEFGRLRIALLETRSAGVVGNLYRHLRTSDATENNGQQLRFVGLAGLLRQDDISALAEVAANVDLISKLQAYDSAPCYWRKPDPVAIRYLGRFAASTDTTLQRCAASALEFLHTAETLPFLASLLDSADAQTRELAIRGLSRFVDNLPIQSPANFPNGPYALPQGPTPYRTEATDQYSLSRRYLRDGEDDAPYLLFWKAWWESMKGTLAPSAR